MTNEEFIKNKCKNCKYKYNDRDICEIRENIKGQPTCVNYQKCSWIEKIKRLLKTEYGIKILK